MLTRIGLRNFKSWRDLDIELGRVTLLFGTNSSGKSSIMQSLLMLKQTVLAFEVGQPLNFGGTDRDYVDLGSYRDVIYIHDTSLDLGIDLSWKLSKESIIRPLRSDVIDQPEAIVSYSARFVKKSKNLEVSHLQYQLSGKNHISMGVTKGERKWDLHVASSDAIKIEPFGKKDLFRITSHSPSSKRARQKNTPISCYQLPDNIYRIKADESEIHPVFLTTYWGIEFSSMMRSVHYVGPLRAYPRRAVISTDSFPQILDPAGLNTIEALIASTRKAGKERDSLLRDVAAWLKKIGIVDSFTVKPIGKAARFYETEVRLGDLSASLIDVGFGVSQVLPVVTQLLMVPEGSTVLIEQPELHLHPRIQAELGDLFLYVARERNLQLIIESHSEHLLRRIQRRIAEAGVDDFAQPASVKTYFCRRGAQNSVIEQLIIDEYGQIVNWPDDFFGDALGDLNALTDAALAKRRRELAND